MKFIFLFCLVSLCYAVTPLPPYVIPADTSRQEVVTELSEEEEAKQIKNKKILKGFAIGFGLLFGAVVVAVVVSILIFRAILAGIFRQKFRHRIRRKK